MYVVMLAINVSPKTLASLPRPPPAADNGPSSPSVAELAAKVAVSDRELSTLLMKLASEGINADAVCDRDCDCAVSGSV